jgi:Holliday junction resolvase-like predicted endonuclease
MHRYNFDMSATIQLRELIDEYGRMRRLDDMSPQRRGQRLNEFVAELLRCWGLQRVQANVRGVGEVDVAFAIDGMRFVLEAKWEQGPVSFEPVAKLTQRIIQRLAGTRGVFLSMSGYTDDALADMLRGNQPNMLLLDRRHFEAMLLGLLSPTDLFTELIDRASYRGDIYVPLNELVIPPAPSLPLFVLGKLPEVEAPVVQETAPGVQAEVVLHGLEALEYAVDGVAVDCRERLLLTMPEGVVRVDPESAALDWAVPLPGCRHSALPMTDGSIVVISGETVLRWDDGNFQILAGAFTGGTSLLQGPDGQAWVFDYNGQPWGPEGLAVTLTRIGTKLGQEERYIVDFNAFIWNAVWLSGRRFYLAGDGHFGVVDLDVTSAVEVDDRLRSPHPDQRGAVRLDDRTVLTSSRHGTLYRIDVASGHSACMAKFDILALGCDLAARGGTAYVLAHRGGPRAFVPLVIKVTSGSTFGT